jgi:HD-like signal output (HDOD) protein
MTQETGGARGLDAWLARIRDQEMPIFGRTAEEVRALADNEKVAVSELSEAILRDPGMTAKLLRIANSAIFNTSGSQITTVSRAIVMLGFDLVRQVALSVAFVDAFLRGRVRQRVQREMALAFHAAVQARWLAARLHDAHPEEVFIAALLYRFGELAFWCFAGDEGDALEEALRGSLRPGEVEQSLLGFRLSQLTAALIRDWRVSPLLSSVLKGGYPKRSREHAVALAFRLAEGSVHGWQSERARARQKEATAFLLLSAEEVAEAVLRNAAEAAAVAESYGADEAARFIPQ